jgi:hypothetical protein
MKYILILVEMFDPEISGDEVISIPVCVSNDREKLVEFRNQLSNAIKEFQIERKKMCNKSSQERKSKINEMIKAYSDKLDLDFELFRFVGGVAIFKIHKIKELV